MAPGLLRLVTASSGVVFGVACGPTDAARQGPGPGAGAAATATQPASADASAAASPPGPSSRAQEEAPAVPSSEDERARRNEGCMIRKNTNVISRCEATTASVGAWRPTKVDIAQAVKLAGGLCYCAKPVERPVLTCVDSAKATTVIVGIGKLDDPTDCTVATSTIESGGRRFVRLLADNRDLATFYQVEAIVEIDASGAARFYEGFEPLTEAIVRAGGDGVSARLKADWPTLSPDLRAWLQRP